MRDESLWDGTEVVLFKLHGLTEEVRMDWFLSSAAQKLGFYGFCVMHRLVFSSVTDTASLELETLSGEHLITFPQRLLLQEWPGLSSSPRGAITEAFSSFPTFHIPLLFCPVGNEAQKGSCSQHCLLLRINQIPAYKKVALLWKLYFSHCIIPAVIEWLVSKGYCAKSLLKMQLLMGGCQCNWLL